MRRFIAVAALILLAACERARPADPPPPARAELPPAPPNPEARSFDDLLLSIARDYRAWGRVDDETRWAPWLCRMPMPSRARFSASDDEDTHGHKLYFLFAKSRDAYVSGKTSDGQVVVKESWKPHEVAEGELKESDSVRYSGVEGPWERDARAPGDGFFSGGTFVRYARRDGRLYRAEERLGLYIMARLAAGTPGTDDGWVYGTVAPDGRVTASGRVASCMSCHKREEDRLFGVRSE